MRAQPISYRWLRLTAIAAVFFLSVSPLHAVTCEEVRGLSATEMAHWAQRLQVSSPYLGALLEQAFCASTSTGGRVIAHSRKRGPASSLSNATSSASALPVTALAE